ncbi:MAG TPA: ATP-binding protein [Thermoanaerobaculia bacterium]|nr:ATP-binding protein [Thermoanaerobaculia bacterium]
MERPSPFALKRNDLPWVVLSLLVLVPCLYYPYVNVTKMLDFSLNTDWKVLSAMPCKPTESCLQVDDRVLAIGPVAHEMYFSSRTVSILDAFGKDGVAPVRLLRKGREMTLMIRGQQEPGKLQEIPAAAIFPIAFWLMGTVAVLFLRPKDERWLVLVLFSYFTAVWFASGFASVLRTDYSSVVFHLSIWLFFPLALHLHLLLPSSLLKPRRRLWLLAPVYLAAVVATILDAFVLLGPFRHVYIWTTLAALLASVGLLVLRLFLPIGAASKVANRVMLYGLVLGLAPFFLIFAVMPFWMIRLTNLFADFRAVGPWLLAVSVLSVPILPMSYIYAIYKHHVGALEFRANRLLGLYSFAVLTVTTYVLTLFTVSSRWAPIDVSYVISVLATSLIFGSLAFLLRGRFQSLVDRHVFGIRHSPDEVIDLVSERIPNAFDRATLARVLTEEILPSLLIRQSALHLLERSPGSGLETLYEQGVPAGDPPAAAELRALLGQSGRYRHPQGSPSRFEWVRLVTPLTLQGETIGVWLLGRRDPDDHYPSAEIQLLTTVANQIATMVENIRLYERAQQEIAQRKAAEEEIRRSEERFRTLFEATLEGIAIVRNGTVLEVNHALLAIFGYAPGELIGRELSDLVSVPETGLDDVPHEGHGFQRDGSVVDIEVAGKKYVFQGEDVTVVAIRDIAQRKRNEAENKMLQRQLLLSQKMEAIGRLSAGVAHDFNNCLLAIFGYNDLMLDRYPEDQFLVRNLTGLKEAGQKAAGLTKQLLAFARRQPMETRVLELNPVVFGLEKMLQRLLGEDIQLVTELAPGLGRIKVDPGQVEQVVVNLAVNSRHAMPSGGRLTIRTSAVRVAAPGEPAPHADVPPGSWVMLSVSDTGIGMDAETQARVFEPFFSTKGEGTGLGLSMAYGIVKQSGGHIFVDSAPGRGATFSLYLPVTQEAGTVLPSVPSGVDDTGSETILLVEDDGEVRRVLHQILVGKGYRVIQAESGDEALAMARMFRGPIHLLLTDVTMPRMKGPELASRLLADRSRTRVLYMSGYNDESLPAEETILQKPFPAQTLTQTIRSILDIEENLPKAAIA